MARGAPDQLVDRPDWLADRSHHEAGTARAGAGGTVGNMLNLHWALQGGLLTDSLDASLVAYATDRDFTGRLHLDGCWDLADQATAAEQSGEPDARVRLDMSWVQVQALADAQTPEAGPGAVCSCLTDASSQLPVDIAMAHYLGVLHTLLAVDPDDAELDHPARVLMAVADVLEQPHTRVHNEPLLAALDQLLAEAAPWVAQVDANRRPIPLRHRARSRYLTAATRSFRDPGFVPPDARDVATVADADAETVAGWWDQVVAGCSWREAVNLSVISARAITGAWLDPSARRLLVRVPDATVRGTLLSRQPVLSEDPEADPSTL